MSGDEFAIIDGLFAPLATTPGARGLKDDAALLMHGGPLVVTADTIVEGVHFLSDDPLDSVARKALRVNLSDLAAKGARPLAYMHCLQWPRGREINALKDYARGLREDQAAFGIDLLGGDLTATTGPLAISITMFGAPGANTPARADAEVGDDVWVTGDIGAAGLGLRLCMKTTDVSDAGQKAALIERYRIPEPRVAAAAVIGRFAHAAMDVSDGLLGDAARIAAASGVALALESARIPFAPSVRAWIDSDDQTARRLSLMRAGDDYEILFSAPPARRAALQEALSERGIALTRIGVVREGRGLWLDEALMSGTLSYEHDFRR